MGSKKKIGFLSYYGFGRGLAHITLGFVKMLKEEYDIYILKQYLNPIESYFPTEGIHITEYPEYVVPKEFFKKWVEDNKLDAVIMNEYKQWTNEPDDHVKMLKEMGVKVYGYLVLEKFQPNQTTYYDRILSPTVSHTRTMRTCKVRKFTYVPYSIDFNEFPKKERVTNSTFTFFHPSGFGGFSDRKNTNLVIQAFSLLNKEHPNTKLIITSQKPLKVDELPNNVIVLDKNLSRQEIIDLYYQSDATVLPSKWETVGIPILESLATGTPVVTMNVPPMNEFVREGLNGYLCTCEYFSNPELSVYVAETTVEELKKKMENIMNPVTHSLLCKNSRVVAEKFYDLEKNKHYLLDFLRGELNARESENNK